MGRGWLVGVVLLSACFDFDLLERPFDSGLPDLAESDLAAPIDLAGVDLAGADFAGVDFAVPPAPDLAGADLAGADLTPVVCPLPPLPPKVLYVAPGGTGNGAGPATPLGSVNDAVLAAIAQPDPAAILIAAGTYVGTVAMTGMGSITLYGGFNTAYTCRDPSPTVTKIAGPSGGVGIVVSDGTFVLDDLTIAGGANSTANYGIGLQIDGASGTVVGTVRNCEVRSHDSLTTLVQGAYAISVQTATLTVDHSRVTAGATNGATGAWGLYMCSAAVLVTDSVIETSDPGSAHAQYAVDMPSNTCGTPALTPGLIVIRSLLFAGGGSGAGNNAFRLGLSGTTPVITASALVSLAGNAVAANNGASSPLALTITGSTLNGTTTTGGRAINVAMTSLFTLNMTDSILYAHTPIGLSGMTNQLAVNHTGVNLLHGNSSTIVASAAGSADIAAYKSTWDSSAVDMDPLLSATDYVHLLPGSPAVGLAGPQPCSTPMDIEGETRPKGPACDVGADEL
jgi:hypothetical protein